MAQNCSKNPEFSSVSDLGPFLGFLSPTLNFLTKGWIFCRILYFPNFPNFPMDSKLPKLTQIGLNWPKIAQKSSNFDRIRIWGQFYAFWADLWIFLPKVEFFSNFIPNSGATFRTFQWIQKIAQIDSKLLKKPRISIGFGFSAIFGLFELNFEFFDQRLNFCRIL